MKDGFNINQADLFPPDVDAARSLLDELLARSRLYHSSKDYRDLLDFVVRLRNFAPYNAMLLQLQKPGLTHAASATDWAVRFGRRPKEGARPLIILWPFGPVALVYDVLDTDGAPLPEGALLFGASGEIDEGRLAGFWNLLAKKHIRRHDMDAGDASAGWIRREGQARVDDPITYRLAANRNHTPPQRFVTIVHELAHLFLGHLGADAALNTDNRRADHMTRELEAESVAYLVCARNGVSSRSEAYLANFVANNPNVGDLAIYQIMTAAGAIERLLGLGVKMSFKTEKV